jgi:hypothetical protein
MKEKFALAIIVAALSGSGIAFAAGETGEHKQPGAETGAGAGISGQTGMQEGITFEDVDANNDGEVTEDEWKDLYSKLDQDGDGKVDQADFAQFETDKGTQQEGLTPEGGMEGLTPEGTEEKSKTY